jgi:hypothetical protein
MKRCPNCQQMHNGQFELCYPCFDCKNRPSSIKECPACNNAEKFELKQRLKQAIEALEYYAEGDCLGTRVASKTLKAIREEAGNPVTDAASGLDRP